MTEDFALFDYQVENAAKGLDVLERLGIVYFSMWMRVGKSLTALEVARQYGAKRVLFLTKPKAISSVKGDYKILNPGYELDVINDESFHNLDGAYAELKKMIQAKTPVREAKRAQLIRDFGVPYDLVIHDEHHRFGAYSKPGIYTKVFKKRFAHLPMIFLSGTPSPEGFSQLFHQFWVSDRSPFPHKTFTEWAKEYVRVGITYTAKGPTQNYDDAIKEKVLAVTEPYMVSYTQEEAGFPVELTEHYCHVPMPLQIKRIADRLMRDAVVEGRTGTISADNAAALKQKVHQLHSGTIILDEVIGEPRKRLVLSDAKAQYIAKTWPTEKLVIFYQFTAELLAIKQVLGNRVTTDLEEFQNSDKSCAFQIVAGREGINLSAGELIVFYNIAYSAVSYWQGRERLTTSTRLKSDIYWLFSDFDGEPGLEEEIYEVIKNDKADYTLSHFRRKHGTCLNPKFRKASFKSKKLITNGF